MIAKPKQPSQSTTLHQPKITEAQIRQLANAQSFDRGMEYYHGGAIVSPTRQGNRIWAECYGSELYQVSGVLTPETVTELRCSCPYDWGGSCKHEVAFLLTYLNEPKAFHVIPPLSELLANHSRDDLLALLDRILQQHPDLLDSLEIAATVATPQPASQPIDTSAYLRRIERAMRGNDWHKIVDDLSPAVETAQKLYADGDSYNAGRFYEVLLAQIISCYEEDLNCIDDDGYIMSIAEDAVEGLACCLADITDDTAIRQEWIDALLDGVLEDIHLGGIDFADSAQEVLVEQTTDDEWQILEVRIREEIDRATGEWERNRLADIIADRAEYSGQGATADEVILELSGPHEQAFILIQQGKYDLATAMAEEHFQDQPDLVMQFADRLIAAGERQRAVRYITDMYNINATYYLDEWLVHYHRQYGDAKTSLEFAESGFVQLPTVDNYRRVQEFAESLNSWTTVRSRLLKQLTAAQQWEVLIRIAIYEQDGSHALKLIKNISPKQQGLFKLNIAPVCEPTVAISIYEELVHEAIAGKTRSAYQEAVGYLRSIRELWDVSKDSQEWQEYIEDLVAQYPTLKVLPQELDRL
jgi:uncharacterized Zn finger protein